VDRRARFALIAAGLLAVAPTAGAQRPPPAQPAARDAAARDTLVPRLVYDDVFPPGSTIIPRLVLQAGVVYRVETQPGQAVSVSYSRQPSQPPLFLVPLEGGPPEASHTASFLVVPRVTTEYRVDIQYTVNEPVRLRIWTDPKEMSRWARMRAATAGLPAAGLSVRAVYFGPFVRPRWAGFLSAPRGLAGATGVAACLAMLPRGGWFSGPFGGCALAITRLVRPDSAGGLWLLTTEPRYELTARGATLQQSVVLILGIGTTVALPANERQTDYVAVGVSYQVATRALGRHLYAEAEAGLARLQELGGGLEPVGTASVVPRLAAGLQLRV
jgi:hypothetical protein